MSDIESKLCDPTQLTTLLKLPKSTSLTYEDVSKAICELQPTVAAEIAAELVKKMQISDLVEAVSISHRTIYIPQYFCHNMLIECFGF